MERCPLRSPSLGFSLPTHPSGRRPPTPPNLLSQVLGTIFQSFWGLPISGNFHNPNPQGFYPEQWVWVGALAVVLSIVAVGVRWRRPEVAGLAVATVITAAASVVQPVDTALNTVPLIGHSWWSRSLIPLAFCLAMLAGEGLDAVLRGSERRQALRWAIGACGTIAVLLGVVWLVGRGNLSAHDARIRAESFVWPAVSITIGFVAFGALALVDRRSAATEPDSKKASATWWPLGVAGALLVFQTVFLVVLDAPLPSSTSTPYEPTTAVTALQRTVGSSLVGLGEGTAGFGGLGLGFAPNTNIPFGIHQFAAYDPIEPTAWFRSWSATNHTSPGLAEVYYFIPGIDTRRSPDGTVSPTYSSPLGRPLHPEQSSTERWGRRISTAYQAPPPQRWCRRVTRWVGHRSTQEVRRFPSSGPALRPSDSSRRRRTLRSFVCGSPRSRDGTRRSTVDLWPCPPISR